MAPMQQAIIWIFIPIFFIIAVVMLVIAKLAYTKYCASKPNGCKKENVEFEKEPEIVEEGIEW